MLVGMGVGVEIETIVGISSDFGPETALPKGDEIKVLSHFCGVPVCSLILPEGQTARGMFYREKQYGLFSLVTPTGESLVVPENRQTDFLEWISLKRLHMALNGEIDLGLESPEVNGVNTYTAFLYRPPMRFGDGATLFWFGQGGGLGSQSISPNDTDSLSFVDCETGLVHGASDFQIAGDFLSSRKELLEYLRKLGLEVFLVGDGGGCFDYPELVSGYMERALLRLREWTLGLLEELAQEFDHRMILFDGAASTSLWNLYAAVASYNTVQDLAFFSGTS